MQEVLSAGKLLWDPTDVLEGGDGQIYVSDRSAWLILRIDAETGDQTVIAELDDPGGLLWHENTLYVTSILGASIFRVEPDPAGATELLAIGAPLVQPTAMALYQDSLIIADAMGGLLSMDIATGTVAVVTSDPATMGASDVAIDGDIAFLATGDGTTLVEVDLSTSQVVDVNPIDNAGSLNAVALGQDAEIVLYNSARINAPGNDDPQSGNDKASVKTPFDQNPEPVGLNEIVVVTDTVEVLAIPNNEITETVTVADQVQVVALPMPNAGVAEAVSVTDTWQVMATPEMRFVETVTVTDTVQVSTLAVPTIRFTETIGVTDSVALLPPRQVGMVETVKVSDSVTLKPFDDDDGDGLTDAIDGLFIASRYYDQRFEYSDQFTDRHLGGDTFGALVDRAGLSFELDNHKTNGVEVFVSGEAEAQGVMKACEIPAEILVSNGDRFELRCGSLILRVLTGDVVVRIDQDTRVEVPAGAIVIVELIADGQFSIRNDAGSTAAVTVVDRGVVVDLQPGETMPTSVWESRAIPVAGYLGWVLMGLSLVLVAGFRRFGKGPRI